MRDDRYDAHSMHSQKYTHLVRAHTRAHEIGWRNRVASVGGHTNTFCARAGDLSRRRKAEVDEILASVPPALWIDSKRSLISKINNTRTRAKRSGKTGLFIWCYFVSCRIPFLSTDLHHCNQITHHHRVLLLWKPHKQTRKKR